MTHFDWYNYYDVAERLSEFDDEGSIRSAISRYYYSAFCSARFYLVEIKREYSFLKKGRIHTRVYEHLQKSSDDNEVELGELLEQLSEKRNCADYDWEKADKDYFVNQLPLVRELTNQAFLNINALKNNLSDFRF